jgi:hypothetical protein
MTPDAQFGDIPANPQTLDVATYLGKTTWVIALVLTRIVPGGGLDLKQELISIDNDGGTEFDARGQAIMHAMNKHPGYQLATVGCARLTAVPDGS